MKWHSVSDGHKAFSSKGESLIGIMELQWLEHLWSHENTFETGSSR